MQVFIRVLPYVRRYPFLAFATLFCAVAGTLMVIVFPAITQQIVDQVIGQNRPDLLLPLVGLGLAAFLAQNGLNALRIVFNNHFEQRVIPPPSRLRCPPWPRRPRPPRPPAPAARRPPMTGR